MARFILHFFTVFVAGSVLATFLLGFVDTAIDEMVSTMARSSRALFYLVWYYGLPLFAVTFMTLPLCWTAAKRKSNSPWLWLLGGAAIGYLTASMVQAWMASQQPHGPSHPFLQPVGTVVGAMLSPCCGSSGLRKSPSRAAGRRLS